MKKFSNIKISKSKLFEADEIVIGNIKEPETNNLSQSKSPNPVAKFFSKLFESKEMAHIYHLQRHSKEGTYLSHEALGDYYEEVVEMIDELVEVYQGQYGVVDGYDIIDTGDTKSKEPVDYFTEVADFIKHTKQCIPEEDTHTHGLVDDIVCLIYKTLYKLKFLK